MSACSALIRSYLLLCVMHSVSVAASETSSNPFENLTIHGFLTQAYVNTSENNWFGDSVDGSLAFTELGVNASLQLQPNLRIAAQGLSRRAGKLDNGSPRLDYGLLDYQFINGVDKQLGIRIGRIKNPLGFYNDTRDVASTRPTIFLPQSIYPDRIRNLQLSSDGFGLYANYEFGKNALFMEMNIGRIRVDEESDLDFLGFDAPGVLHGKNLNIAARIMYEYDAGRIRLGLTGIDFGMRYDAAPADFFASGRISGNSWIVSAEYNSEFWSLTSEYMYQPVEFSQFGLPLDANDAKNEGYYLQGQYRISDSWTLVLRYDASFQNSNDRDGNARAAVTGLPEQVFFSKDTTLGIRWDISSQLTVRGDYHYVDGSFWIAARENQPLTNTERYWNIFSLLISYNF